MNESKVFFVADTHFGDEDVYLYENRPFANVSDMDAHPSSKIGMKL